MSDFLDDVFDADHQYGKNYNKRKPSTDYTERDLCNLWMDSCLIRVLTLRRRSGLLLLFFLALLVRHTQFGGALQSGFVIFLVLSFLIRLPIHLCELRRLE